jgi:hypothetical protein
MLANIQAFLREWNTNTSERQKLQHAYLLLIVAVTFVAGIVSVVNGAASHNLMRLVLVIVGAFVVNGVAWHLLNSFVLFKLGGKPKRR